MAQKQAQEDEAKEIKKKRIALRKALKNVGDGSYQYSDLTA